MSISELKQRWESDKEHFKNKEIGELQSFIEDIFKDKEIFSLEKGLGTTKNNSRKYEFTIETNKGGRRADFVIYINGEDVIIPVEVERHENIQAGVRQLYQYQKDWNKKYGILTDGNKWRFYRSNAYQEFTIDEIFREIDVFKTYWKDYIKPENYYIELFNPSGQLKLFKESLNLNCPENRVAFFDDITSIAEGFNSKMRVLAKQDTLLSWQEGDKKTVEITYSYLIQFILYKVLVDNGFKKFEEEYKSTFNKISKAINDKDFYSVITQEIMKISEYISTNIYKPFALEQKEINKKLALDIKTESTLDDISPWLDIILFIDRYSFAGLKNEIFGFIYENFLKELYKNENKGQYFTDPAVVNFMLKEMGYTKNEIKKRAEKNKISLIDVSCGAGTFLYSAVDRIITAFNDGTEEKSKYIEKLVDENIFGLDIEEFPLYLAEVNILMRMLPLIVNDDFENPIDNKLKIFKTKDSISEFLDIGLDRELNESEELNLFSHLEETNLDYPSFMRDEKDLEEMLKSLQGNMKKRTRFDYVIGNPPYVFYNKLGEVEFKKYMKDKTHSFSMGNVYGVNLNTVAGRRKAYSPKPNLYAFFIALGLALLKEKGKLCYIVPQTILTESDNDVLRYHLSHFTTIDKIITFDGKMFVGRGLKQKKPVATSSLIFIVSKSKPNDNQKIQIVNIHVNEKEQDFKRHSNKNTTKTILQKELQNNLANWNFIKHDSAFIDFIQSYNSKSFSIEQYRKEVLDFYDEVCLDGGFTVDKKLCVDIKQEGDSYLSIIIDNSNYKIKTYKYFSKKNNIYIPQGSRGLELLKLKHKIIWKKAYAGDTKFAYTDLDNVIMSTDYQYFASDNKNELLFLFTLLNSYVNKKLFSNLFSLGEEKVGIFIVVRRLKDFFRIPDIKSKKFIKDEIIKQTEVLLSLEDYQLKDFVEFTTTQQRFQSIAVKGNTLILIDTKNHKIEQKITSKPKMIKSLIEKKYKDNSEVINLKELQFMEAVDLEEQEKIKDYIDDLVFALYFDIPLKVVGLDKAEKIKLLCKKNEFYDYIHNTSENKNHQEIK